MTLDKWGTASPVLAESTGQSIRGTQTSTPPTCLVVSSAKALSPARGQYVP